MNPSIPFQFYKCPTAIPPHGGIYHQGLFIQLGSRHFMNMAADTKGGFCFFYNAKDTFASRVKFTENPVENSPRRWMYDKNRIRIQKGCSFF